MPNLSLIAVTWEDTELQADLTMGNIASALTLQSEEAALLQNCGPAPRKHLRG